MNSGVHARFHAGFIWISLPQARCRLFHATGTPQAIPCHGNAADYSMPQARRRLFHATGATFMSLTLIYRIYRIGALLYREKTDLHFLITPSVTTGLIIFPLQHTLQILPFLASYQLCQHLTQRIKKAETENKTSALRNTRKERSEHIAHQGKEIICATCFKCWLELPYPHTHSKNERLLLQFPVSCPHYRTYAHYCNREKIGGGERVAEMALQRHSWEPWREPAEKGTRFSYGMKMSDGEKVDAFWCVRSYCLIHLPVIVLYRYSLHRGDQ